MKYSQQSIKINYHGAEFWFLQNEDGSGAVAPLHHCEGNGDLNTEFMFSSDSFAHVGSDRIMRRYGEELGKIEEFIPKKRT